MSRPRGRPVSVPQITPPVPGYHYADTILPEGQVSIGAVASALGLGRHQARRVVVGSPIPWTMHYRAWPQAGRVYTRRAIGVPASALHVLVMIRMEKILRKFPERYPLPGRWRQRKWRARRLSWRSLANLAAARLSRGR